MQMFGTFAALRTSCDNLVIWMNKKIEEGNMQGNY
jgi:hypothetical protein